MIILRIGVYRDYSGISEDGMGELKILTSVLNRGKQKEVLPQKRK